MVAAATIRIMKTAWITYLSALSRLNVILIPRILAHPPILALCHPGTLFPEGTVYVLTFVRTEACACMQFVVNDVMCMPADGTLFTRPFLLFV